jgi:chemotaxis protein methyltransferase CheR
MLGHDPGIPLSDEEFHLLRDLVYNHSGLFFDDDSKYILEKRLGRRLAFHQLKSFKEYYQFLKFNRKRDQELADIMDLLTTNETYFFRESFQLKAFTDEIIPEVIKRNSGPSGNRTIRIWSAGCSTGEEPYTIAMLLLDIPALQGWKIEIIGTDISQKVLQQARRGVYASASFRVTDHFFIGKYFTEHDGGLRINDSVRELVTISHLNLLDKTRISMLGGFDVIFCRNVIIYFDQLVKKRVVETFHGALKEGGFLLMGHSESLMNLTTLFSLRHFKNDLVYQRPTVATDGVTP